MTTTVAQAHRQLVAEMDEAGDSPEEIATKLGISVDRVEAILDQLDGVEHLDDAHRAPAVEPVADAPRPAGESARIVVGSPARAPKTKPAVEVRPVPEAPALTEPAPEAPTAELVAGGSPELAARAEALAEALATAPPSEEPAVPKSRKRRPREHGTVRGAQQHWSYKEEVCDDCREAYNAAKRKSAVDWPKPTPRKPRAAKPATAFESTPARAAATNDAGQTLLIRPGPAVAHLLLPLTVASLTAITDALELAYGPDLCVEPADGGLWVMGRAS